MPEVDLPPAPVELSTELLFRYRLVAHVLARVLFGVVRADAVAEITGDAIEHVELRSGRVRTVSARTLYRWLAAYDARGLAGLEPEKVQRRTSALSPELVAFLRTEKLADPYASVPELLRRAVQKGLLGREDDVDRVTTYRALRRLGVPLCQTASKRETDMRRFAYPHRMQMLLVDGKHFRAGGGRLRRVVFFFIDDCSRFVPIAVVGEGSGESTEVFLRGLFNVICCFGLMDVVYFDHGSAFIAGAAHAVIARLGIRFVHGKKGYPEGRAKVERFNRTAGADLLRALRRPEVDTSASSLELRIRHYLDTQYNERAHEGIGNVSPRAKWNADERELRFPTSVEELRSKFFIAEARKVSLDNLIKMDGALYEVPRGHADTSIEVRRHLLDPRVCILHQGRIVELHTVDLARNAEARRAAPSAAPPEDDTREAPMTAASLAFERDFGPVLPASEKPALAAPKRRRHKE